ncbi:MAG: LuxR C-terminal-related transcriptional regulator [Bacteroides sp.]|nr:LuxR C-terminal-related transcriptional regulator [Bacteroides sp.]
MNEPEQELKSLLMRQEFSTECGQEELIEIAKGYAYAYAQATNGIAVLSDFQNDVSHIYSGSFGRTLGLPGYVANRDSAFEREVFDNIPYDELIERHILELRFFHFLKSKPVTEKIDFNATCLVHFQRKGMPPVPVLHTTRYLLCHPNGSVWLGLCTYTPFPQFNSHVEGSIVNDRTGDTVCMEQYDDLLLSRRQIEILSLLAKGEGSKQIADKLSISVNTVSRHRQDILTRLHVTNTAAAVEIGLRTHLI